MAASAERQMNLSALQQRDPYISAIVDTASQVALYCFSSNSNEWEKTSIEGTLFVYSRSASPINGFMILNRLGLNDLIEPINRNLEFQLQDPFLLYRNEKASIFGIWFYDKDECARIGQLMNSYVQVALETQDVRDRSGRLRRASESDSIIDRITMDDGGAISKETNGVGNGVINLRGQHGNVDILQMLSKALDEYDKSKPSTTGCFSPKNDPKPLIDNPNASALKSTDLLRPRAMKMTQAQAAATGDSDLAGAASSSGATAGASGAHEPPTTLEKLFRQASLQHEANTERPLAPPGGPPMGHMPPILQRLMSNPVSTVEEIERQQRGETPRDQMPKPVGEEAPPGGINGASINKVKSVPNQLKDEFDRLALEEPDSPNTALKRSLNILPPAKSKTPSSQPPHETRLRTSTSPALLGRSASSPYSSNNILSSISTSMSVASGTSASIASSLAACQPSPSGFQGYTAQGGPLSVQTAPTVRSKSGRVEGEGLITPQALLQTAAASLPSAGPTQGGSGRSNEAANVLLTPMVFQTSRTTPPVSQRTGDSVMGGERCGDLLSGVHGLSPSLLSPATSPAINPLNKEQLQQALIYLLKNDSQFVNTLHEAYVKSLNLELTSRTGGDRS